MHVIARTRCVGRNRVHAALAACRAALETLEAPPTAPAAALGTGADPRTPAAARPPPPVDYTRPKHYAWADLLERTFAIDVLACPECGGRLRFLATIEDRAVVEKILRHLDLPVDPPTPAPACVPGLLPGFDSVTE